MDTKTITAQTKKAVAIGLCASLVGGVAAPVLSTANVAHAAVAPKPPINTQHSHIIQFKDANLKKAILTEMKERHLIDQAAQDITEDDAPKVTVLLLDNKNIQSIEGLESFKNLITLDLIENNISDIKPLSNLTKLTHLNLDFNNISNLTPLAGLTIYKSVGATNQRIWLYPKSSTVDLKKEIKGAGKVVFGSDENIVDGVLTHKHNALCSVTAKDGENYSATITIDFSKALPKSSETQTEDVSLTLAALLKDADNIKACDNYKNADGKLKQAYDTAIKDGKAIYDKLSSTPEQVKQAVKQIQAALDKLNGDKKAQAIKEQLSTATQQISSLQGELEKAKQQGTADASTIATLTGKVSDFTQQLEKLKGDKTLSEQQKQDEIDKLNGQIAELGKQIEQLTKEKGSLQQQLDAATGKVSTLTSELEQLKAAKKQADEKNEQTIAGLNTQITQLGKDKQGLQEQINTKQTEISKLQGQIQALKDDHSKSDTEKQKKIEQLTAQLAALTQEKQGLQGKLEAANEKISTLTQQLQQAASKTDADTKQIQELTHALQQAKQQLEQLKSDKTKSDEQKQHEIDTLNAKIAELEKKVQTCNAQAVGGAIVAPLVNEKPTFDIEKYKREHNYMLPGIATHTYQTTPDTFTSDVHAALQQLAPMTASTNAAAQATAQRTDENERAQAEQKADTSSKQDADKTKLDQNKFPQTGDNSLLALLSTFAGALVLVLGCFARKKSSKANKR